jgi:hypothetical protein
MRWVGHAACIVIKGVHKGFWWENLKERVHFEDPVVDGAKTMDF